MSESGIVKISAIVCTLNRAAYLAKAVESLINQTYPKEYYEIIVVDNGSTDNTREVVEQFSQFARIRYIYEPIKGLCQARNTGWQAAGGKYVAYLDDDAIACPHWLEKMMEAFDTVKPAPASVGGKAVPIWESERPAWLEEQMLGAYAIVDWGDCARFLNPSSPEHHVGCNIAYSREVLEECGGFNVNLGRKGRNLLSNDENLIRQYIDSHGLGIYYDPAILVKHLIPKERLTRRFMLRRHFWQGISDVVLWYEQSASKPRRLWSLISGLEGLAWVVLYLIGFLLWSFLRRPVAVARDLSKIETARNYFFRSFDRFCSSLGQAYAYLRIGMGRLAEGTMKGVVLEQEVSVPSRPPPKNWNRMAWWSYPYMMLKRNFLGIGGISLLAIAGLYIAGALVEPLRWYLVGIASALILLGGGVLALSYIRFILNRLARDQRAQVSNINKQISSINKQISSQVSNINKQVSNINKQVSNIKKEVAPYEEVDRLRIEWIENIEKQVEMAELQNDLRDSKPILFFNATSGPGRLSFASTAGLVISWALRLSGHKVIHLVCRNGLRRCIQGTNRHEISQAMPCEKCYAIRSKMFPRDLRWYLESKTEVPSALLPLGSYSLDELADFVYQGIKIGELCISSVRWTLRRHRLESDPRATRLLREYIRGGMGIVDTLQRLLQEQELHSMVVFNGVFYPEAIAREVALHKGLPVVAYEVSQANLKVFLSHGVAAGGGLITIPEDFQMSAAQEADLDEYMAQRIKGNVGQPGLWPEMKDIEPDLQALAGRYKNVVSVFTNVIFDTSQYGANTVFESMFDWLDEIMKLASLHPETLFIVRAHPAEVFPRHESEELVGDWLKEQDCLTLPNVHFIPPTDYISSYELLNVSNFCLVYNSTIGLESVIMGIPTVTAASGRYSGAGATHAPTSRKAYRKLVEIFLKNGPPPVEDTVRQRARHCMYQLFFRQGLDLSAFLETHDRILKPIDASALHPDNSPEMNIIYKGIIEGGPFYYPH